MRDGFLTNDELLFLQKEKNSLQTVQAGLTGFSLPSEDLAKLQNAIAQLDELFLIVAAGEFNAGKSALVNACWANAFWKKALLPRQLK